MGASINKIHPESNIGDLNDFYKIIKNYHNNLSIYLRDNTETI